MSAEKLKCGVNAAKIELWFINRLIILYNFRHFLQDDKIHKFSIDKRRVTVYYLTVLQRLIQFREVRYAQAQL